MDFSVDIIHSPLFDRILHILLKSQVFFTDWRRRPATYPHFPHFPQAFLLFARPAAVGKMLFSFHFTYAIIQVSKHGIAESGDCYADHITQREWSRLHSYF